MKFTKMHGCGNDYIYINGAREQISEEKKPALVRFLSDRHFGIGSDGVIFILPSREADFEMEMWNADGTRAEMCGNGIRCVGKYVYDYGLTDQTKINVISAGKIKKLELFVEDQQVKMVRVNMGKPELRPERIPVRTKGEDRVIAQPIEIQGKTYRMTCVSMGNPHAVVFLDEMEEQKGLNDIRKLDIEALGPHFENNDRFPNRVNTEFVRVLDRQTVEMRVWERGTGETLACGTGCCATVVSCVLNDRTDNDVIVRVLGGEIRVQWDRKEDMIYMTGPAQTVFEGEISEKVMDKWLEKYQ